MEYKRLPKDYDFTELDRCPDCKCIDRWGEIFNQGSYLVQMCECGHERIISDGLNDVPLGNDKK